MPKHPWTPYAVLCGTELCFCRLCNFDLPNKQRFSLQRHKSTKPACAEFLDSLLLVVAQSFGCGTELWLWHRAWVLLLLKKQGNSTFCKVVKQKGEGSFCVWKLLFYQQPCAKAQEFCKAEFLDSTSVLALECFFVYRTGVLISEFSAS